MPYLLDTDILSLYARKNSAIENKLLHKSAHLLAISSLTVMEIEFGFERNLASRQKFGTRVMDFIEEITVIPFSSAEARMTAVIRAELERIGQPIGKYDSLIAGTALAHGLVIVTHNTREYSRITGLRIEDWSIPE